jgi:hypothetical protein
MSDQRPSVTLPLPRFLTPPHLRTDPPLATVEGDLQADPTSPLPSGHSDQGEPPPPSLEPPADTRTRTSSGGKWGSGDPDVAARVLAGVTGLAISLAAIWAARRAALLRQPTPRQLDEICEPLGRIAVRWLPMAALGNDIVDATQAIYATRDYVFDGPLIEPIPQALPEER